jgi:GT2 family glycosyltransferase
MLPANALYEVIRTINAYPSADFIYTDEDKISENGKKRFDPHFKPDWSPDNLRSHNYITHFTVIKRTLLEDVGWFRSGFEGSQDYDLILRATEKARQIIHIPKILYHWRVNQQSVAGNPFAKRYAYDSAVKAIEEHLERIGYQGNVENGQYLGTYKIGYALHKEPCVTVVLTSRQDANLHECICSIIEKSTYANYEIIAEAPSASLNDSGTKGTLKYTEDPRVRFEIPHGLHGMPARMNYGGQRGRGDFLVFLDAQTRVISPDWIERMLALAQRSDVGAVGGKLYYTNNEVAFAGKVVGLNGNFGDCFRYSNRISPGYVNRLSIVQNYSAVSGVCLMVKTATFLSIGGFEEKLSNLFYDVDLCLRLRSLDYLIVFTPFVEMFFCQNIKSHKNENLSVLMEMARYKDEARLFSNRWRSVLERGDPYYNPNLTTEKGYFPLKS